MFYWRAFVMVTGIPEFTEEDMARVIVHCHGSVAHESGRSGGKLSLRWNFAQPTDDVGPAVEHASAVWRKAVAVIHGKKKPVCADFRVMRISSL